MSHRKSIEMVVPGNGADGEGGRGNGGQIQTAGGCLASARAGGSSTLDENKIN